MHELSVTQSVLEIALREAEKNNAMRIVEIQLVIGDLAGIVDDSVRFYFDIISRGSLAEGATLKFRRVAPCFRCRQCDLEFSPKNRDWSCPSCGVQAGEVVAGREFYLESIEIE